MSRAERRHHYQRLKAKWKKIRSNEYGARTDDVAIGYQVSTHGKGCSCHMCGNPRKYFNEKTMQEKKADITDE
jgi:hypothetical protein